MSAPQPPKRRRRRPGFQLTNRFRRLVHQPIFWVVTALGNGLVAVGAILFDQAERGLNPGVNSGLDSLFWSVSMVTSVGFGDVVPVTPFGKVIGIGMMTLGTLFLWAYMALFVAAFVSPDLTRLEREIDDLEQELSELQKAARQSQDTPPP